MNNKELTYLKKYEEQKDRIEEQLVVGEEMKHCLDKKSFGGKYYNPCWVVTSKGRIYSLYKKAWMNPWLDSIGKRKKDGSYPEKRYCLKGDRKVWVHLLVANYFCDKAAVELYGEKNVDVHHRIVFDADKSCEENNYAGNLYYTERGLHQQMLNRIQRGTYKKGENMDSCTWFAVNNVAHNPGSTVHIETQPDGKLLLKTHLKLRGTNEGSKEK